MQISQIYENGYNPFCNETLNIFSINPTPRYIAWATQSMALILGKLMLSQPHPCSLSNYLFLPPPPTHHLLPSIAISLPFPPLKKSLHLPFPSHSLPLKTIHLIYPSTPPSSITPLLPFPTNPPKKNKKKL